MELGLISAKPVEITPFDLDGVRDVYTSIMEAVEEVGGGILYRAKIGSGGSTSFEIVTGDETMDTTTKTITGVVIHSEKANAWFDGDGLDNPPACSSIGGIYGTEAETGTVNRCEDCPRNQYGSAAKGSGKACKNMIRLYIMAAGSPIPIVLSLPPTSIKAWQNYRISTLGARKLKPIEVVTELSLTATTSKGGQKYAIVKPKLVGKLEDAAAETARYFAQALKLEAEVTGDDYNKGDTDGQ